MLHADAIKRHRRHSVFWYMAFACSSDAAAAVVVAVAARCKSAAATAAAAPLSVHGTSTLPRLRADVAAAMRPPKPFAAPPQLSLGRPNRRPAVPPAAVPPHWGTVQHAGVMKAAAAVARVNVP
eukprot:364779-Chlamydomonas_euryale.AAC.3